MSESLPPEATRQRAARAVYVYSVPPAAQVEVGFKALGLQRLTADEEIQILQRLRASPKLGDAVKVQYELARASIATYLRDKSALSSIDVHFDAGTFTTLAMTAPTNVNLLSGYSSSAVFPYMTAAWNLLLTPAGREILSYYTGSGSVAQAVALYNTIFSAAFGAPDYGVFAALLNQLNAMGPMQFGAYLAMSDLDSFIQGFVAGVNYITWGAMSLSLPYICGASEILVPGATNWVAI